MYVSSGHAVVIRGLQKFRGFKLLVRGCMLPTVKDERRSKPDTTVRNIQVVNVKTSAFRLRI